MKITGLKKDNLHHAYLVSGGGEQFDDLQRSLASLFGVESLIGNPDAFVRELDALSVADARAIVEFAGRSALIAGASKIIIITFSTVTPEAQNALLKTLEEPAKDTYIFLLTPSVDMLLPTVLSRCQQVTLGNLEVEPPSESAEAFIKANVQERLKIIGKIVKGKDKSANKAQMLSILSGVEAYLAEHKELQEWQQKVEAVLQAKQYMHGKGAMAKMLMESVALVL